MKVYFHDNCYNYGVHNTGDVVTHTMGYQNQSSSSPSQGNDKVSFRGGMLLESTLG